MKNAAPRRPAPADPAILALAEALARRAAREDHAAAAAQTAAARAGEAKRT